MKTKYFISIIFLTIITFSFTFAQEKLYESQGVTGEIRVNPNAIDLSSSNLTEVPDYVFRNNNTEELILKDNKITSLPYDIRNLKMLKILDISGTDIKELPDELRQLVLLQELYLPYENFVFSSEKAKKLTHAKIILK